MFYLQSVFISISVALPTLAAATIAARFYARHVKKLPLGADDWTILATLVCASCVTWKPKSSQSDHGQIIVVADSAGCIYAVIDAGVGQLITLLSPADAVAVHKVRPPSKRRLRFLVADASHSMCTRTSSSSTWRTASSRSPPCSSTGASSRSRGSGGSRTWSWRPSSVGRSLQSWSVYLSAPKLQSGARSDEWCV